MNVKIAKNCYLMFKTNKLIEKSAGKRLIYIYIYNLGGQKHGKKYLYLAFNSTSDSKCVVKEYKCIAKAL